MTSHIAYDDYLEPATITLQNGFASGFPFEHALGGATSRRTKVDAGQTGEIHLDLGIERTFNCLCLARHNLGSVSAQIELSTLTLPLAWLVQETVTSQNDQVFLITFPPITSQYIRLRFLGHVSGDLIFSDIMLTNALTLPRPIPDGFTPPEFGLEHKFKSNLTSSNQLAGLTVEEKPLKTKLQQKRVPPQWVFDHWTSLTNTMKRRAIYWRWKDSGSTMFCWPAGKIDKPRYKKQYFMDFSLNLEGYVE